MTAVAKNGTLLAAAIAVCGMLEIIKTQMMNLSDTIKMLFIILHSLASVYSTRNMPEANYLLHGVYGNPRAKG